MSYSTLPAPTDLLSLKSALHSHRFTVESQIRRDSDSRSPTMSEPRSPLFRTSFPAELPPQLASLYSSPYAAAAVAAAVAGQANGGLPPTTFTPYGRAPGHASFYPGMVSAEGWRRTPYLSQLDLCWPQNFRALDTIVGPRTKAPREATSILKSWLNEHKDNPYPTKSEKMTLSIVTHMTLTQVSTWFANARRRIKKENKMTWIPKTRCGDRDGSSSNEDENDKDNLTRDRSPFPSIRGDDIRARRSSVDLEPRRESHLSDAASSSSLSFSPEEPHKHLSNSHSMFSALHRLHPQFYNAAAAAAAASFLNSQCNTTSQRQAFSNLSPTFSSRPVSPSKRVHSPVDSERHERRQQSNFAHDERKHAKRCSDEDSTRKPHEIPAICHEDNDMKVDESTEDQSHDSIATHSPGPISPFVQLRQISSPSGPEAIKMLKERSPINNIRNNRSRNSCNASEVEKDASRRVAQSNTPTLSRPNGLFNNKLEFSAKESTQEEMFTPNVLSDERNDASSSEDTPKTPTGDGRFGDLRKGGRRAPCDPGEMSPILIHHNPFFAGTERIRASPVAGENHDALSSWIRDFQLLVASGQEHKAKQALATALAAAAKAGAYSGRGPRMAPPYYHQGKFPISEKLRPFITSPEPQVPLLHSHRPDHRSKRDSCSISSESSRQDDNVSPMRQPGHSPLNASRYSPESTPINLSKTPLADEWKRSDAAEDRSAIEA